MFPVWTNFIFEDKHSWGSNWPLKSDQFFSPWCPFFSFVHHLYFQKHIYISLSSDHIKTFRCQVYITNEKTRCVSQISSHLTLWTVRLWICFFLCVIYLAFLTSELKKKVCDMKASEITLELETWQAGRCFSLPLEGDIELALALGSAQTFQAVSTSFIHIVANCV